MKLSKLNKLWCVQLFMIVAYIITSKFCNNLVNVPLRIGLGILSIILIIYSIKDFVMAYKARKNKKAWLSKHVSIIPESREVVITVNSKLEKWEENIISKLKKDASELNMKVTENSPLQEIINQYYL